MKIDIWIVWHMTTFLSEVCKKIVLFRKSCPGSIYYTFSFSLCSEFWASTQRTKLNNKIQYKRFQYRHALMHSWQHVRYSSPTFQLWLIKCWAVAWFCISFVHIIIIIHVCNTVSHFSFGCSNNLAMNVDSTYSIFNLFILLTNVTKLYRH